MAIFDGKSVVVTGAGRGIGREVALAFARHGAKVVVSDLQEVAEDGAADSTIVDAVVSQIAQSGGVAIGCAGSVVDFSVASSVVESCLRSFGSIDVLVNAAGVGRVRPIWEATEDDFEMLAGVHLKGTFNMCRHACARMRERGAGCIVNFTSDFWRGLPGFTGSSMYSAVKAGVVGLTRSISQEMMPYGVTCNAVAPLARTRMLIPKVPRSAEAAWREGRLEQWFYDDLRVPGGPEHIPPAILFLASEQGKNISGKVIGVSKGRVALYAEPYERRRLQKSGLWTVEELCDALPGFLS